jgi:hypothetical protein
LKAVPELGLLFDTNNWAKGAQQQGWELCVYAKAVHIKTFSFNEAGEDPSVNLRKAIALLYLLNNPTVLRISGKTYQQTDMDAKRGERSGFNVEELGLGFVRVDSGLTLNIIEAWAVHMDKFDGPMLFGLSGGLRLEPFSFHRSIGDLDLDSTVNIKGFDWRQYTVQEIGDVYDSAQHHWIAALQGRVDLLPIAELALTTMLISEGIYLSDKLDREVTADEVREMSRSTAIQL